MAALAPSVAATRTAVAAALTGAAPGALVAVACSGGADSLALALATAFVAPRLGLGAALITIDHGLQDGSAGRADSVVRWGAEAGFDPAQAIAVDATARPGGDGPEGVARGARYAALSSGAARLGATAVLLGHTEDDQAETVLLALARGAGLRGIAAMPATRDIGGVPFLRPFLALSRAQTLAACAAQGASPWTDPHNQDPAYARARVRAAMRELTAALGPDLVPNLARTARLAATDAAALDEAAAAAWPAATSSGGDLSCAALAGLPAAIRTRVLRLFALAAGTHPGALATVHIDALDHLVTAWRGQGPAALPGGILVARRDGHLRVLP